MKKYLLVILLFLSAGSTKAQLLLHETFNYTPDPVLGLWTQSSQAWLRLNTGDSVLVDAGSLSYTGLAASAGNKVKFDGGGA
ncbi:MAG TPA: hypothetical protein PLW54_11060, partial [Bacteroidia bacterium]|nr:hypothetical protein [Bacteroidia bacterium]